MQVIDAQGVKEAALHLDHIGDGQEGEVRPVRTAGRRVEGRRPGRPGAAAEHVGADDEVTVGIESFAGPDHRLPPARFARLVAATGGVRIAGKRVADQNGVVAASRKAAVSLISHADLGERLPAAQSEPFRESQDAGLDLRFLDRQKNHSSQ